MGSSSTYSVLLHFGRNVVSLLIIILAILMN